MRVYGEKMMDCCCCYLFEMLAHDVGRDGTSARDGRFGSADERRVGRLFARCHHLIGSGVDSHEEENGQGGQGDRPP